MKKAQRTVASVVTGCALLLPACDPAPSTPAEATRSPEVRALLEKAVLLHREGRADEAIGVLDDTLRDHGPSYDALMLLAGFLTGEEDDLRATKAALAALERKPDAVEPARMLGILAERAGDFDVALGYVEKVLSVSQTAVDYYTLGKIHSRSGRLEKASGAFRGALQLEPDMARSHYQLGILAMRRAEWIEAERRFRRVRELNPRDDQAAFNLANLFVRTGRQEQGAAVFETFRVGKAVLDRIDLAEAAVRADPKSADALCSLADLYVGDQRIEQGVGTYLRALKEKPDHVRSLRAIARIAIPSGHVEPAIQLLRTAVEANPHDPEIRALLANLEWERK